MKSQAAPAALLPPGPESPFDLGSTDDSLDVMLNYFREFGDTYRVHSPTRGGDIWVIAAPDDVKRVLVTNHRNYTKGIGLDRVKILLGNGIMVSEGEFWRKQRRMIQPAFHRKVIARFADLVAAGNHRQLHRWELKAARHEPVNITTDMSELTLDIVLRSIFGADLDRLGDAHGDNPFAVVTREPARNLLFAFRFRSLSKVVAQVVQRRREKSGEEHFDFLAMLMSARDAQTDQPMSDRELTDEIMTLIVAGHETTAAALNWTWYLLSQYPEAEARLHAELEAVPDMAEPGLQLMESLTYTQQVIHEALRLYPPGWLITRRSLGKDRLGGFELPAGTDVLLSPYLIHRHPAYWQDPERFMPERFTPEAEAARPRYAYIPFVAGPRHCVGETFALYEMAMHLFMTARRFRFSLHPDTPSPPELEAQINLRPRRDIYMTIEPR
jgi:cytochrome P450